MASKKPGTVKRSVTLRSDVDAGIQELAGRRGYSAFINDAAILALQSRAIGKWILDLEQRTGPLSTDDEAWARKRLEAARRGVRK